MNNLSEAVKFVKKAITYDDEKNLDEAAMCYNSAVKFFNKALFSGEIATSSEKNEIVDQLLYYLNRATEIEVVLKETTNIERSISSVSQDDVQIIRRIENSMLRLKPNTKFSDVCGMETAIRDLKLTILLPIQQPQIFVTRSYKSFLFYGVNISSFLLVTAKTLIIDLICSHQALVNHF